MRERERAKLGKLCCQCGGGVEEAGVTSKGHRRKGEALAYGSYESLYLPTTRYLTSIQTSTS